MEVGTSKAPPLRLSSGKALPHTTREGWGTQLFSLVLLTCSESSPRSSQPLRVLIRAVEIVCGLVEFKFSFAGDRSGFRQQASNLFLTHWVEAARRVKRLLEDIHRLAAGNDHACRQAHCVVQTLDWGCSLTAQYDAVAHRFHAEHSDPVLHQHRQNFLFKAVVMSVHDVERHLHGIEGELVSESCLQHLEMNVWTLVSGKADVTNLALFFRFECRLQASARAQNSCRISFANHLVELQQINMVGLQAAQRFFELLHGGFPSLAVNLGHEERLLPIAIA